MLAGVEELVTRLRDRDLVDAALRALSPDCHLPASTDSTILIFFSSAICGGLGTMTTSLARPITPL
jgi:hypothetical protein